jgi:hypothetical protein
MKGRITKEKDGLTNTHEDGTSMDGLYPAADDDYNSVKDNIY